MGNDMRTVKFRMMIKDIYVDLGKKDLTDTLADDLGDYMNKGYYSVWLAVVYDYNKLNEYGKIIMDQVSQMTEEDEEEDEDAFSHQVQFVEECQDIEYRTKAAKAIVQQLDQKSKLHFMFWALMILAVDDADKEEHLSLICDFAKMFKVGDAELMDLVRIIQGIYDIEGDYKIQTEGAVREFRSLIKKYEIPTENNIDNMTVMATGMAGLMSSVLGKGGIRI